MTKQMDWTGEGEQKKPRRPRKAPDRAAPEQVEEAGRAPEATPGPSSASAEHDPLAFPDTEHLRKKGLRVVPVVTGAVVDAAGNFLFYVDGHEDARSGVQAQLNHLLESGPSREEHLAPARARARFLAEKLSKPR